MAEKQFLELDYNSHPAFSPYADMCPVETSMIDDVFAEIDTHLRLLSKSPDALSGKFVRRHFSKLVEPLFNELLAVVSELLGTESFYGPLLSKVFADARLALQAEIIYKNENKLKSPLSYPSAKEVSESGVAFLRVPKEEIWKIWSAVQPYCPEVQKIKDAAPWEVASLPLKHQGPWWDLTNDLLIRSGALNALSNLHGCPMIPLNCGLILSQGNDEWYKGCYSDVGLPTSRTAYMHLDHAFSTPKMILYLVDVSASNGPFGIIPYGDQYIRSKSQTTLWKFMDWHADQTANTSPKYKSNYRRKRYHFPELRKELMRLPNQLRGTSHFGEDILDGTPISNLLLEKEVVCTGDVANCIVFDGATIFHRGGLVQQGERWIFQMGFTRAD